MKKLILILLVLFATNCEAQFTGVVAASGRYVDDVPVPSTIHFYTTRVLDNLNDCASNEGQYWLKAYSDTGVLWEAYQGGILVDTETTNGNYSPCFSGSSAVTSYIELNSTDKITSFLAPNKDVSSVHLTGAVNLETLDLRLNPITSIGLSYNTKLDNVDVSGTNLTVSAKEQVYIDLDAHGLSNGYLTIDAGATSAASLTAANNLVTKGWYISNMPVVSIYEPEMQAWIDKNIQLNHYLPSAAKLAVANQHIINEKANGVFQEKDVYFIFKWIII